jgi:hypothetical protein
MWSGFSWNQMNKLMPLVLPYQNAENAFRVISEIFTIEDGTGIVTRHRLLVQMMQSSERGST